MQKVVDELEESSNKHYVPSYHRAIVYLGLNRKEQAFEWLEKAYQEHNLNLISVAVDPTFDSLREDARVIRLLQLIRADSVFSRNPSHMKYEVVKIDQQSSQ